MRFLEKFSKSTFSLVMKLAGPSMQSNSLESVVKSGVGLLDPASLEQMKVFVRSRQTPEGGFMDLAGRADLYYSVFGCFVAEALGMETEIRNLKTWVDGAVRQQELDGIHLNCGAILCAKLNESEPIPSALRERVLVELHQHNDKPQIYVGFLGLMTYFYLRDLKGILRLVRSLKTMETVENMPCPVTAAQTVLMKLAGRDTEPSREALMSFYKGRGGFMALINSREEDLLSTAVALYALRFIKSDIRIITPDCLEYVDSLFEEGGFHSMAEDLILDIEYTFYGLLALGALNHDSTGR